MIGGMLIGTDADSRSLLLATKVTPKELRKVVTKGGRATLTGAQLVGLTEAVDDFIQAVMDRQYDLEEAIEGATTQGDLDIIDITAGWPANGL